MRQVVNYAQFWLTPLRSVLTFSSLSILVIDAREWICYFSLLFYFLRGLEIAFSASFSIMSQRLLPQSMFQAC